jgi:hypothetical protein
MTLRSSLGRYFRLIIGSGCGPGWPRTAASPAASTATAPAPRIDRAAFTRRLRRACRWGFDRRFHRFNPRLFTRVMAMIHHGLFRFRMTNRRRRRSIRSRVEVGRLQRSRTWSRLPRLRFFALQPIAHPFAHVWLLTQSHHPGQWKRFKRTKAASKITPAPRRPRLWIQ